MAGEHGDEVAALEARLWPLFFARLTATLKRCTYISRVSAPSRRPGSTADTIERNTTSRSEPWKSGAVPTPLRFQPPPPFTSHEAWS